MLIDLRELLSGSQDERIEKVSIESESFDTGIAKYSILEKPEFELSISRIGKNKLEIKAESFVVLDIPCDRCLESVPTKVEYSVDEIVDFSDNAAGVILSSTSLLSSRSSNSAHVLATFFAISDLVIFLTASYP